jgi:hypothetical protein
MSVRSGTEIHSILEAFLGNNGVVSLKLRPAPALIYANLFDDEGEEIIPLAWRPRELAEDCRRPPCPVRLVGAP